jgi:phosphate transport system permease protein
MKFDRNARRRVTNWIMSALALGCVIVALIPLLSIIYTAVSLGGHVLSLSFLISPYPSACSPTVNTPVCPVGGIGPAIEGTGVLLALASLFSVPPGILAGIYLSEFGRNRFGRAVSFFTDVMTGSPSMVVGIFVYTLFYLAFGPRGVFNTLSGAAALAFLMIPIVTRTTEEALRLVPNSIREAAYALGIPRYRAVLHVVLTAARGAVLTGAVLAVMRAGGEAAPLLVTALGNPFGFQGLDQPTAAIPPIIFNFGTSPYANQIAAAWGASLVLIIIMLCISLAVRYSLRSKFSAVT